MEYLWDFEAADAKAIHRQLGGQRNISSNTIQSTADRLYKKGLLNREKVSHAFVYSPAVTREQLMAEMIDNVVDKLSGGSTDAMLSAFVDLADRMEQDSLDRLETLIAERRQKR